MLNTTNDIAKRYHIEFGNQKSQILTIGPKQNDQTFQIGEQALQNTDKYKYLGITINNKGNMEEHIKQTKGKLEAAIQTIFSLAGNTDFRNIEMDTIWKLVETSIIPIITYGAEANIPTKKEMKQLQQLLDNILKRSLHTPRTTPSTIISIETGITDVETAYNQKQIMYYYNLCNNQNKQQLKTILLKDTNQWLKHIKTTMEKIAIDENKFLSMTKKQAAGYLNKQATNNRQQKILKEAETKSKTRDLIIHKTQNNLTQRPNYMITNNRKNCTNIFMVRSRMMHIKGNYKNMYQDLACRWCKQQPETQEHIITSCKEFKAITKNVDYNTYFKDDPISTTIIVPILTKIQEKINAYTLNN